MNNIRILCILLLFLPHGSLEAQNDGELTRLCFEAAKRKNVEGYSAVCQYLYTIEEYPEVLLVYADSIRQLAIRDKSLNAFLEYYSWSGEAYFMKGDFSGGFDWKRKALVLAERTKQMGDAVAICSDIGYYYNVATRYDSARYYLKKGIYIAENMPERSNQYLTMLTNYASSFLFEGKTDSALVHTLKVKEQSFLEKDTAMLIENLNQLGAIYRRKKNLDACIRYFEQALSLCEAQGNFGIAAYIYGNIATVYSEWKRPKDAIPFSEKALKYALKLGTPQMIGICYVNLGAILCNIEGKREESIATLRKALPVLQKVNNERRLCEAYNHLTNAFRKLGQTDSAMVYLRKLDGLVGELKTDVERFRYYEAKAPLLQANRRFMEAISYYHKMIDLIDHGIYDTKDYDYFLNLSVCYHAIHDDASAYKHLQKAYALRDSANNRKYAEHLSDFSVKYQTKEKELEIVTLKREQLEQETYMLRHRIIVGSVISLLVILLLGLLYARQRQRARIVLLASAASEKEHQFVELQKETELRLTRKYIDGLESERGRMATELHDDVCNSLLALEMNIRTISAEESPGLGEQLDLLSNTRERVRTLSHELMPPAFQYATLDEMLADYVLHLSLPENMHAEYHSTEGVDWNSVPKLIGFECYRIVQEAVSNAVKYAGSACVRVNLALENNNLSILVTDDGKGFDMSRKTKGIGLRTIWQRAETIGAKVELTSAPGEGTRLKVNVLI